jgi:Ca2+-binding EF-hand superfamily protein
MVPELAMMVRSLVAALRSVSMTFVLALGIMYIFAILLTQWARNHKQANTCDPPANCVDRAFGTIPKSFLTLLQILCFDDTFSLIRAILSENVFYGLLLIVYILIAAFTVLNMLIGVVCQIVSSSSQEERSARQRQQVRQLFSLLEVEDTGFIARKELERNKHVLAELEKVGVGEEVIRTARAIFDRKNAFSEFTTEAGDLDMEEFLEVVFKLLNAPQTQDILLVQSKLEKLEKAIQATGATAQAKAMESPPTPSPIQASPPPEEEEEQTEEQKALEDQAREAIARGMSQLESQVASMLEQATEATGRAQKPPDEGHWDLELRRLDAAMCRLRVRLERCQDEKGPANSNRRGGAADEAVHLANTELQCWRKLCAEVVQSISAASSLMAQAIREVEPDQGDFRGGSGAEI